MISSRSLQGLSTVNLTSADDIKISDNAQLSQALFSDVDLW